MTSGGVISTAVKPYRTKSSVRAILAACAALSCAACGADPPPEAVTNAMPTAGVLPAAVDAGPPKFGLVPNADSVIASLRPRFRGCFNRGLDLDPHLDGAATFAVDIGPDGAVTAVERISIEGLTEDVSQCLSKVLASAHFEPPERGRGRIDVPIHLKQQN